MLCNSIETPERFALIISAIVHDLDHPGHNNNYEVNSHSELAIMYNDKSVLENHHCAAATMLMKRTSANILSG